MQVSGFDDAEKNLLDNNFHYQKEENVNNAGFDDAKKNSLDSGKSQV